MWAGWHVKPAPRRGREGPSPERRRSAVVPIEPPAATTTFAETSYSPAGHSDGTHAEKDTPVLDSQGFGARDGFDAVRERRRELDAVRPLFGAVRAAEVAEARATAAAQVERELLGVVAGLLAAFDEEPVVVVQEAGLEEVDSVLVHEPPRAGLDVRVREAGHGPGVEHALRGDERRPRVDDRRPAPHAAERERHRAVLREESAAVLVEGVGHLGLLAGELALREARALLDDEDPIARARERAEAFRDRPAARARADHDDVVSLLVHALRASHPRASAR